MRARRKALEELQGFTARSIDDLKERQDGDFLQGEAAPARQVAAICCTLAAFGRACSGCKLSCVSFPATPASTAHHL